MSFTRTLAATLVALLFAVSACGSDSTNTAETPDLPVAFVAKIVAADGQSDELATLLTGAVDLANEEEGTIVWFAVQTDADTFWIFDAFPDSAARDAHANGAIVEALLANEQLLGAPPEILPADVLASKVP